MFDDDEQFPFKKMHGFSTVDGFVEVSENLAEMIRFIANEPSVGLFYIQQHTQNAVPNIVNLQNNVAEKSRSMTLHGEDLEDSITMMRSMKESGFPVADEMIREIKSSLAIMSTKQPKTGLLNRTSSVFQMGRSTSWGPSNWSNSTSQEQDDKRPAGYLSSVFKTAKQKASNFKWPQLEFKETRDVKVERPLPCPEPALEARTASLAEVEADELPLSSPTAEDEVQEAQNGNDSPDCLLISVSENFEEFRADREVKLEQWLGG